MRRRLFVQRLGAIAAGLLLPLELFARGKLEATPSQAEGPYYPPDFSADAGPNLLRSGAEMPDGTPLALSGRVTDQSGKGLAGMRVEIWQADSQGIYDHPRAPETSKFDRRFQGYGAAVTDKAGRYQFLTLVPTPYTAARPISMPNCGAAARNC